MRVEGANVECSARCDGRQIKRIRIVRSSICDPGPFAGNGPSSRDVGGAAVDVRRRVELDPEPVFAALVRHFRAVLFREIPGMAYGRPDVPIRDDVRQRGELEWATASQT